MNVIELCEPVFEYVCRINRVSGSGGNLDQTVVRSEIKALFEELQQRCAADHNLAAQFRHLELPLLFFIDSMIAESRLGFAAEWGQNRLAYERNEMAGDEKFFDLMEETMQDTSTEASERLVVFYTCLGLGFCGMYAGQPEQLRRFMVTIAPRIRQHIDSDQFSRMCPEAYEGVDTRNLIEPPGKKMVMMGVIFAVCALSVAVSYVYMFEKASASVEDATEQLSVESPSD